MTDIIVIAVVAVIVGLAGCYVYKAKKGGKKCIGCPYDSSCSAQDHIRPTCCCGVYEQEK